MRHLSVYILMRRNYNVVNSGCAAGFVIHLINYVLTKPNRCMNAMII